MVDSIDLIPGGWYSLSCEKRRFKAQFARESCRGRIARAKNGPKRVLFGASKTNQLISLHILFRSILHNDYYGLYAVVYLKLALLIQAPPRPRISRLPLM